MTYTLYLNKQQSTILQLLRTAGSRGVNSYDLRFTFHLIQAPVRIKELKEKGFLITTRNRANRSVDYILIEEPHVTIMLFGEKASVKPQQEHLGTASMARSTGKPVQERLFDGGVAYA